MITCIVPSCPSNAIDNPKLTFFNFPKHVGMKQEWLEVLSLKKGTVNDLTKICELHFKAKDFRAGKKSLKVHAIPLRVSRTRNSIAENSDDDSECGSDSDPEILEVKKISKQEMPTVKKEKEITVKQEPIDDEPEPEPTRRSSRRAAQLAVKKIQNTVRNLSLPSSSDAIIQMEPTVRPEGRTRKASASALVPPPHPSKKFRDQKIWHAIRVPPADIELEMECHEELLSSVQMNYLVDAQNAYNAVMQKLRILKSSNARIICLSKDELESPPITHSILPILSSPPAPKILSTANIRSPNLVTLTPASKGQPSTITVVPVRLLTVHSSAAGKAQLKTSSPTVTLKATSDGSIYT